MAVENSVSLFNVVMTCIRDIENFDGTDPDRLPDFIQQIENIYLTRITRFDANDVPIILNFIKNKCVGRARDTINRYGPISSWLDLKERLKIHFGEKESSSELMDKLKTCRLDGTIENYFYKLTKLTVRILNRVRTHENDNYSAEEVNRIALNVFKEHLPEPTKTMIFARDPNNIDEAYRIILQARHQTYTRFGRNFNIPNNNNRSYNFSDTRNNRRENENIFGLRNSHYYQNSRFNHFNHRIQNNNGLNRNFAHSLENLNYARNQFDSSPYYNRNMNFQGNNQSFNRHSHNAPIMDNLNSNTNRVNQNNNKYGNRNDNRSSTVSRMQTDSTRSTQPHTNYNGNNSLNFRDRNQQDYLI